MAAVEEVLVCVATTVATLIKIVDLITEKLSENIFTLAFTGKWDIYFFADNAQKQSIPLNFGTEGISRRVAVNGRSLKLPTTLEGNDESVPLPTGFRKSLCFTLLPYALTTWEGTQSFWSASPECCKGL